MMTKEEARNILSGYVKACREDDMLTLETFGYEDVMEAMSMGAKALQQPSLPSDLEEAAENPYVLNDVSHAAFEYERTRNDLDARSDNEVVRRAFKAGAEWMKRKMMEGATYNELMELYRAIRDELVKRHCDVPVNIKEKTMDLKEDTGNESALHQIRG